MNTIFNYTITQLIYDSPNSLVYRAIRNDDRQPVIFKQLKADYPTPTELTRYHHEFEILSSLKLPGVIQVYDWKPYQNTLLLVVEDLGGDSLTFLTKQRRLTLVELLPLLIQATDALGQVHAADLIHKDINPNNLVCNLTTGQVKLIDFGIASRLPRENPTLQSLHQLEGTLAYLSPEQTGRMNRALDYRTDLYSLGVTFYELLTGQLPFISTDPLEVVHGHLAKRPVPVHEINLQVPRILSDLVMKLMAKNAEDRYQSAFGVKYDLEQILVRLKSIAEPNLTVLSDLSGLELEFELAQQDISGKFHLPQRLYGREAEIETLWQAFDRISHGTAELLLVAGYSGIGKTALVQELYKPMTATHGYFIAGKFDQFQRNVPYSAVVKAFRSLVQQLLTEPETQLANWQAKLQAALGANGQVVVEVIPEVELIIGKPPAVPTLPPTETQNRFNLVFQNFIKTFCAADHPLVIFLDDLQWADSASLKLLTLMMNDIPYLLVLGAYRDNEVNPTHPLMTTLEEMQKMGVTLHTLTLAPLTRLHLQQFLADTLSVTELSDLDELANLLLEKTGGNPFFLGEFVKTLYAESLLQFNYSQRRWQWDLTQIQARQLTNNVVELMAGKIQQLAPATQQVLKLAASLGNQFDLNTLALIAEQPVEEVQRQLWETLARSLVLPLGDIYKFVHDRVQQAAYSLIPEGERPVLHWRIGQLLLNSAQVLEDRLFEVVDHLNVGLALATTQPLKTQIASLNLQAGQKAKAATAYQAATKYFQTTLSLLPAESWTTDYSFTLAVYEELTESAYLTGDYAQVEAWAAVVLQQAQTILHCIKVYEVRIQAKVSANQLLEAIAIGLQAVSQLGLTLPSAPTLAEIQAALVKTAAAIPKQDIPALIDLPEMTAANALAILRILVKISPVCYIANPPLLAINALSQVQLSVQYGNAPSSAFSYSTYGVVLNGVGEIMAAYQSGQVALQLVTKFQATHLKSRVYFVFATYILHARRHLKEVSPLFLESYQSGLDTGDLEFAGYALYTKSEFAYYMGQELTSLAQEIADYSGILHHLKQSAPWNWLQALQLVVRGLLTADTDTSSEAGLLASLQQANDKLGLSQFYLDRVILYYLLGEYQTALAHANQAKQYLDAVPGSVIRPMFYAYHSLCLLATVTEEQRDSVLAAVAENQQKFKPLVDHAPMNFQHKHDLIEAETARVLGQAWQAVQLYEKAIQGARDHDYLQEEALAYELAANFYLTQGLEKVAKTYFQEAAYRYDRWGAAAKVKRLQTQYPQFLTKKSSTVSAGFSHPRLNTITTFSSTSSVTGTQELDLNSIIKASLALSSEMMLDKLLVKLMTILMENAGAQRGCLILESHRQLRIEAEGTVGQNAITVLQSLPIEQSSLLSEAIIQYVARTQQSVVLNDATTAGNFTKDPYILAHRPQSVLCTPLLNQGKLTGILYLENNLTTGAFPAERVALLNLLSSQAAISLENARLYTNLTTLNRAYERFVPREFLQFLEKDSITEVQLGDQVQKEMSILFSDIRSFTSLSEKMSPEDNFKFINAYLSRMEPVIGQHHGFIDKYIGDAIMALFSGDADNAVHAGIAMLHKLAEYNQDRQQSGYLPIRIGIGINTGRLMLGTVGGPGRMDGTVISDAVNLASRIEGMTKIYGATLLITEHTYSRLRNVSHYALREIDKVKVKGKAQAVTVYEVFDGEAPERIALKRQTLTLFKQGLVHYRSQEFVAAISTFQQVLQQDAADQAAQLYLKRSEYFQQHGVIDGWEGIVALDSK